MQPHRIIFSLKASSGKHKCMMDVIINYIVSCIMLCHQINIHSKPLRLFLQLRIKLDYLVCPTRPGILTLNHSWMIVSSLPPRSLVALKFLLESFFFCHSLYYNHPQHINWYLSLFHSWHQPFWIPPISLLHLWSYFFRHS